MWHIQFSYRECRDIPRVHDTIPILSPRLKMSKKNSLFVSMVLTCRDTITYWLERLSHRVEFDYKNVL